MLKKIISVLAIGCLMGSVAFATETSIGGGLTVSGVSLKDEITDGTDTMSMEASLVEIKASAFLDVTYAQIQLGYAGINSGEVTFKLTGFPSETADYEGSLTYLTFGILGKYPIKAGSITIFPLLGLEYKLNLTAEDADGNDLKEDMTSEQKDALNEVWIKGGLGADLNLSPTVYIRPSFLIGYKFLTDDEQDAIDASDEAGLTETIITVSADFSLAIGLKL